MQKKCKEYAFEVFFKIKYFNLYKSRYYKAIKLEKIIWFREGVRNGSSSGSGTCVVDQNCFPGEITSDRILPKYLNEWSNVHFCFFNENVA